MTLVPEAASTDQLITGEELLRMPGTKRCELVRGKIKRISPTGHRHGVIELEVAYRLREFASEHDVGTVMVGEVGIYTGWDPDTVRAADVLFISHDRLDDASPEGFLDVAPELAVEIMSPENAWEEMRRKLQEYFDIGVNAVWVVEPKNRAVQVYRDIDEVQTLIEDDTLEGDGPLHGFTVEVGSLFES